jgi:hypothetical protein
VSANPLRNNRQAYLAWRGCLLAFGAVLAALLLACPLFAAAVRLGAVEPPEGRVRFAWVDLHASSTRNQECLPDPRFVCLSEHFGPDAPHFYRVWMIVSWPHDPPLPDREYLLAFFRLRH